MTDLTTLAMRFQRFADQECGSSPLYRRLASGVAGDPELLALAAIGESHPKPNLLLAAVHYLLLKGAQHPLAACYPTVASGPRPEGDPWLEGDPYLHFRAFCLEQSETIARLMSTRRVQTNEVARAAFLLPAFTRISRRTPDRPLALVEVGASAGLLLLFDQYGYDYGDGRCWGSPRSPVQLRTALRGAHLPPLPGEGGPSGVGGLSPLPPVVSRVGLDLYPIDVADPDQALWLRALVWADQPERFARLDAAIRVATAESKLDSVRGRAPAPLRLVAGDGLATLPAALAEAPADATLILFHCHTLNQFTPQQQAQFADLLAAASTRRAVQRLSLEYTGGGRGSDLTWSLYRDGVRAEQQVFAHYHAHGEWLEWCTEN